MASSCCLLRLPNHRRSVLVALAGHWVSVLVWQHGVLDPLSMLSLEIDLLTVTMPQRPGTSTWTFCPSVAVPSRSQEPSELLDFLDHSTHSLRLFRPLRCLGQLGRRTRPYPRYRLAGSAHHPHCQDSTQTGFRGVCLLVVVVCLALLRLVTILHAWSPFLYRKGTWPMRLITCQRVVSLPFGLYLSASYVSNSPRGLRSVGVARERRGCLGFLPRSTFAGGTREVGFSFHLLNCPVLRLNGVADKS